MKKNNKKEINHKELKEQSFLMGENPFDFIREWTEINKNKIKFWSKDTDFFEERMLIAGFSDIFSPKEIILLNNDNVIKNNFFLLLTMVIKQKFFNFTSSFYWETPDKEIRVLDFTHNSNNKDEGSEEYNIEYDDAAWIAFYCLVDDKLFNIIKNQKDKITSIRKEYSIPINMFSIRMKNET